MFAARVHVIIQLLCMEVFTFWGCGVIALLQLTVGVFYGIARREVRLLIARREGRQKIGLKQLHLK